MSNPPRDNRSRPESTADDGSNRPEKAVATSTELTPEEQMEAYEEALKEEDWGHQPC